MAYLLLFLSSFAAATFLPISSEAHLYLLLTQKSNVFLLIGVATLGNTLGSVFTYYMGTLCKWNWIEKYLRIKKVKIQNTQVKIEKYGSVMALLCWLPIIGDVIAVSLGVLKINWKTVVLYLFIGKMFRYLFFALLLENYW